MKITPTRILFIIVLLTLLMVNVIAFTSWINFHNETKQESLWFYEYYGRTQYLNGQPYYGDMLFPISPEHLAEFGRGLVFYFKTLDDKYQNVSYAYTWTEAGDVTFSLSITSTYQKFVCDALRLVFVILLNILILALLLFIPFTIEARKK